MLLISIHRTNSEKLLRPKQQLQIGNCRHFEQQQWIFMAISMDDGPSLGHSAIRPFGWLVSLLDWWLWYNYAIIHFGFKRRWAEQATNEWMDGWAGRWDEGNDDGHDGREEEKSEKQASFPQLNELLCIVAVHIFSDFFWPTVFRWCFDG